MATDDVLTMTATAVAGAAVLLASLITGFCASPRTGLQVFLDLMLAAGLLRLAAADTWGGIATVAALAAVRKLAGNRLTAGHGASAGPAGRGGVQVRELGT